VTELLLRLAALDAPARMAKFVVQKPTEDRGSLKTYLMLRDDWRADKADCLKVYDMLAFCLDRVEMHAYKTHDAIGIPFVLPLSWVKGFQWAEEVEHEKFFDIHAYKDPN
jgi:hypothetical protein